ncbi:MAG: hypothetical protein L7S64_11520 [Longimicrobiales bacterium]|nr:hypothetical protein [Longimicrobiales bacterium]
MTKYRLMVGCFAVAVFLTACGDDTPVDVGPTPPPLNGTAFIDPDILTIQDSTAFESLVALGAGSRDMYDVRVSAVGTYNVWLFQADFDDALSVEIRVNAEFDSLAAVDFADLYARRLGVLPNVLRAGMVAISVHDGRENFLGLATEMVVHAEQGETYRLQGFLEEVMAHEAVHISLDEAHANSPGWIAAQESDPTSISGFARDFPRNEDLAETFGAWLAVRWAGDSVTAFLRALIVQAVPARLEYLDAQNFVMYPVSE